MEGGGGRLLHKHESADVPKEDMSSVSLGVYGGQGEVFTTLPCLL